MNDRMYQKMNEQYPPLCAVFAGGGTGGHLFPAIAVAQEFLLRNSESRVLFIGSGRPIELNVLPKLNFPYRQISVEGIKGRGPLKKIGSIMRVPKAIVQSMAHLRDFQPQIVFGVGGYSAGPVITAAWMMGIKTAIHEQNILPGLTNRMLFKLVNRIYFSYEKTHASFDAKKVLITGNPVRKEFHESMMGGLEDKERDFKFTVFVMGGSQGAHAVNISVIEALPFLKNVSGIHFIHQTGEEDEEMVRSAFQKAGISSEVKAFFTRMAKRYQKADLIIGRAGATSMAEMTALGKPAILVPFPFAADNHQEFNARALVEKGGAEMILERDLNGRDLAERIMFLKEHPEVIGNMSKRSKEMGDLLAAEKIVSDCYGMIFQ